MPHLPFIILFFYDIARTRIGIDPYNDLVEIVSDKKSFMPFFLSWTNLCCVFSFFCLIETLHNTLFVRITHPDALGAHLAESEDTLDDTQLGGGGVETGDGEPVVDDHARTDDRTAAVDAAGDQRHL